MSNTVRSLALSNCPLNLSLGSGYVILRYAEGLRAPYQSLAVVLVPAIYEGFGLVTAEALCQAVETLAADEPLRQTIARGGYRRAQALRWDGAIATVETSYLRWLGERRNRPAWIRHRTEPEP